MASPEYESLLPKVQETDLLALIVEEVTDPSHTARWKTLAVSNPLLARELLKRSFTETLTHPSASPLEQQRRIIDTVTFAISALEQAARRLSAENARLLIDDDDGDEGRPLSA